MKNNCLQAFLVLIRAGLWDKDILLLRYGAVDYKEVYRLAEEQSVVGLITAGLNHVIDTKIPKYYLLQFIGASLQMEERNKAMNYFIGAIAEKMHEERIDVLLVKGQGIAQCYENPLWRASGDVDFLFDEINYSKAKDFLSTLADSIDEEDKEKKHVAMTIGPWVVELHGTLRGLLWKKLDDSIDAIQQDAFHSKRERVWKNDETDVLLPAPDDDVIFIFTHILQHYFKSGIGLRQICDWCRLLWTYRDAIDTNLLRDRLEGMGIMTEWKAFAAFAVNALGMPEEALPLYDPSLKWKLKANRILTYIMQTGNFGHNRETSYITEKPFLVRKAISFWRHTKDVITHLMVFPNDAIKVWLSLIKNGLRA